MVNLVRNASEIPHNSLVALLNAQADLLAKLGPESWKGDGLRHQALAALVAQQLPILIKEVNRSRDGVENLTRSKTLLEACSWDPEDVEAQIEQPPQQRSGTSRW